MQKDDPRGFEFLTLLLVDNTMPCIVLDIPAEKVQSSKPNLAVAAPIGDVHTLHSLKEKLLLVQLEHL